MGIWGKREPASDGLIDDRCWNDEALDQALDRLASRPGPAGPDHVAIALDHLATVAKDADRMAMAAAAFGGHLRKDLPVLRQAAHDARSDAEQADALSLLGDALIGAAWDARGDGWAETVSADSSRTFWALLEEADEALQAGQELVPVHAAIASARIWTGIGLGGLPEDEWWNRFAVVRAASPDFVNGHLSMLQALCQKWYGSHELMFEFARETVRTAPIGSPVTAVLPMAHCEFRLVTKTSQWNVLKEDSELLLEASRRWLAGGHEALAHPSAPFAHQLFGWAFGCFYTTEGNERAKLHLTHGTRRIAPGFWAYEGSSNPHKNYLKQLKRYKVAI